MPEAKAQHFITRYPNSDLAKMLREVHGTKFDSEEPEPKPVTESKPMANPQKPAPVETDDAGPGEHPCQRCKTPSKSESGYCSRTCRTGMTIKDLN
jgi:hypothetical protein